MDVERLTNRLSYYVVSTRESLLSVKVDNISKSQGESLNGK